jgi:hypothetical protein
MTQATTQTTTPNPTPDPTTQAGYREGYRQGLIDQWIFYRLGIRPPSWRHPEQQTLNVVGTGK